MGFRNKDSVNCSEKSSRFSSALVLFRFIVYEKSLVWLFGSTTTTTKAAGLSVRVGLWQLIKIFADLLLILHF